MSDVKDSANPSGPVEINGWKVHVDRDLCIGAGTCIAVAAKAYELDGENKAVILSTIDEETQDTILESAKACPVAAIIIEDAEGHKVFPK